MNFHSTKKKFKKKNIKNPFRKDFTEKKKLKIIFLVLNCKKNNFRRAQQTWLKKLPDNFKYFHVQGDPSLNTIYKVQKNLITVKCDDGYLCLPKKVLMGMKVINKHFDYDYIFKTDDDINWKDIEMLNIISKYLVKKPYDYGGADYADIKETTLCYCQWYHDISFPPIYLEPAIYFGGNFYFISKNIIKKLQHLNFNNFIIEDHAFGYHIGKITKNIKKIGTSSSFYHHNFENGHGFYFDKRLSQKLSNNDFKFLKFSNNKIIDCLKNPVAEVIFIYNTDITHYSKFLDFFSHIQNKDCWDIIFSEPWHRGRVPNLMIGPKTKDEFLMEMANFYRVRDAAEWDGDMHFIIKKSATARMSLFLSSKIYAEELFSTMKIYFTPYYA